MDTTAVLQAFEGGLMQDIQQQEDLLTPALYM